MIIRGIADFDVHVFRLACAYGLRHTSRPPRIRLWSEDVGPNQRGFRTTDEDKALIEQMWAEGIPARDIASRLGLNVGRVWSYVNNHRDRCPRRYLTGTEEE